jgi:hypothetical protein
MVGVCNFLAAPKADAGIETLYSVHAKQIAKIKGNRIKLSLYECT